MREQFRARIMIDRRKLVLEIRNFCTYLRYWTKLWLCAKGIGIKSYSRYLKSVRARGGFKTRIVFQVNLNSRTVNHYIDVLTDGRLLEVLDVPVILYRTIIVGIHTCLYCSRHRLHFAD